ncbi:peptidase E [Candidatus Pacearchaeota archaeon]|nr:peptidase E [Candidatus Pacearchaeota archaeon]
MNLILMSDNSLLKDNIKKEFLRLIPKKIENLKIAVLYTLKNIGDEKYLGNVIEDLVSLGIKKGNIKYINLTLEEDITKFELNDVLYVCGGNTYYILNRIKKLGLESLMKNLVKKGSLYLGVSAGSIIAGEDIKIARYVSEGDKNEIGLRDLSGLGFTNISIFPHFREDLLSKVEVFRKKVKYPVQTLKDGEAVLINNKKIKVIK